MAHPIRFDKDAAERRLEALNSGRPIPPPPGGWTGLDILALAGVCHFAATSHGPVRSGDPPGAPPPEDREAREDTFSRDLRVAIEFHSQLAMRVADGQYDEHFEPIVEALVSERHGQRRVQKDRGFRPG
jgi:hypothetical protein